MINVEGDYSEIVRWLDAHTGEGVQYSGSHGIVIRPQIREDDEPVEVMFRAGYRINYGIFSVCEDYISEISFSPAAAEMSFNPVHIEEALKDWDKRYGQVNRECL